MKYRINIPGYLVADVEGETAEALIAAAKVAAEPVVKKKLGIFGRVAVKKLQKMTPLKFGQEVVSRYNAAQKAKCPMPENCQQFVDWAVIVGYATKIEPPAAA